jgi:hypothetical protein
MASALAISAYSQSGDPPPDASAPRAELAQKAGDADKATPDQPLSKTIDSMFAELQRLSEESKANRDKIAQTVMLRSDLLKLVQDSKASSEKTSQIMLDQIDALRADQVKFINDAKAQVAAVKAESARSVDAMKKDLDELRQNISDVSPVLAIVIALAALVLGPLLARQLTANQLAAAKKQAVEVAEAPAPATETAADDELPLAPPAAAELPHEAVALADEPAPEKPATARQTSSRLEAGADEQAEQEKV